MISHCDAEPRFFVAAGRWRTIERCSFGNAMLLAFIVAQALDGVLTYVGIATFGASAEANPVVAWYVSSFGVGAGLALVKALAIACAATLHATARHWILAGLTAFYRPPPCCHGRACFGCSCVLILQSRDPSGDTGKPLRPARRVHCCATQARFRTPTRMSAAAQPLPPGRQPEARMFMFDRRQLFVGAALIVLIEIVTAAMRAAGQ